MNSNLRRYINFLLENDPSPFCEYIINKELLELDDKTIYDSYEWAKRFKLYSEIADEQFPDGSWGGYIDALSSTDAKHRKYKATSRAISRIIDLSLDVRDDMVRRVVEYCRQVVAGEIDTICMKEKKLLKNPNLGQCAVILSCVYSDLAFFSPDDKNIVKYRNESAIRFKRCCVDGVFNIDKWSFDENGRIDGSYTFTSSIDMLSYGNVITDDEQRVLLSHEWTNRRWQAPCNIPLSDSTDFHFWLYTLESLQNFSLFGEFMAERNTPYLYSICEQIVNDIDNRMSVKICNYYYHHGQYSESRNTAQKKKNDLLLQIIRLLNKCE